jgi:hypothetical protein
MLRITNKRDKCPQCLDYQRFIGQVLHKDCISRVGEGKETLITTNVPVVCNVPEVVLLGGPGRGGFGIFAFCAEFSPTARPSTMPFARPEEGGCRSHPETGVGSRPTGGEIASRAARAWRGRSGRAEEGGGTRKARVETECGRHIRRDAVIPDTFLRRFGSPLSADRLTAESTIWLVPS